MTVPDYPPSAVQAVAKLLFEIDDWSSPAALRALGQERYEPFARELLDAAWPHLADGVAKAILAHMHDHGPKPAAIPHATEPGFEAAVSVNLQSRTWRRHMRIAAQVAATALFSDEELRQRASAALARGDVLCSTGDPEPIVCARCGYEGSGRVWEPQDDGTLLCRVCAHVGRGLPLCANCGLPIKRESTSTGWTHDSGSPLMGWQGVRCPGKLCGAVPEVPS